MQDPGQGAGVAGQVAGGAGQGAGGAGQGAGGGAGDGGGGAGGGAGAGAAGGAGGAGNPVQFAFSPARLNNDLLDFTVISDSKLHYKAILPLEDKFDLSSEKIRGFLSAFNDRARHVNWVTTLQITVDGVQLNLAMNYGSITLLQVKQHAEVYFNAMNRDLQNSTQIYQCLSQSLTTEAKAKVILDSEKYTIGQETDGLLYFKVIMSLAQVDTRATISVIRTRLSSLDSKMLDSNDDIKSFNRFVKSNLNDLAARGETTTDLLINLFKAYRLCKDDDFKLWLKMEEQQYYKGSAINPKELMDQADNLYQSLVDTNQWLSESESDQKIVALTAQIQSLKDAKAKPQQQMEKKNNKKKNPKGGGKKGKNPKGGNQKGYVEPAWVTVAPGAGKPIDKIVDEKDYHWCKHHGDHGKWVRHTREDCDIQKEIDAAKEAKEAKAKKSKDSATMRVNPAGMSAVLPEDDDY